MILDTLSQRNPKSLTSRFRVGKCDDVSIFNYSGTTALRQNAAG
jgi:hypothetical protein